MSTTVRSLGSGLLAAVLSAGLAAQAAEVREVPPAQLPNELRGDQVSVVLFTSPDPGCGYCKGYAEVFDEFARGMSGDVRYLRVQWSPWRSFPAMDIGAKVRSIPITFVFRGAQPMAVMKGNLRQPEWLKAQVDNAMAGRWLRLLGNEKPPPAKPGTRPESRMNEQQRRDIDTFARSELLGNAVTLCSDLNVRLEGALETALAGWRARHRALKLDAVAPAMGAGGGMGAPAVVKLILDADQDLARSLEVNEGNEAGCRSLLQLLAQ